MSAERRIGFVLGIAAGLLALLATPGRGFLIQTFEGPRGKVQLKWSAPHRIPFLLHRAGSDNLSPEQTHQLLRESFQIWADVPTCRVAFLDRGLTATRLPSPDDRQNLVYFDETGAFLEAPREAGVIAITHVTADELTGAIQDADIVFNGRDFRFASRGDYGAGTVDLKDVAVHEIGHFLGLDHTPLEGPPESRPTMNPFNRGDGPGEGQTLEADDIAAISVLYPAPGYLAATGTFSGQVTAPDNTPLFGAHLIAENLDTGERISTLSGAYPEGRTPGHYFLRGLTPGRYHLVLAPVPEGIDEENFSGIFTDLAAGFPTEYYENADSPALARTLVLEAGQQLDSLDFATGFLRPGYPFVQEVSRLTNTPDDRGPYAVRVQALEAAQVLLRYRLGLNGQIATQTLEQASSNLFVGQLPGQPLGTQIAYQIEVRSAAGNAAYFPARDQWWHFEIVQLTGAPLAFTALRGEDVVSVIDTGDQRERARIPVGDEPIQVLLVPGGNELFVSNLSSDEVYVIDPKTFQVRERIQTSAMPLDLALAPDGQTLYVANSGAGTLTRIERRTRAVQTLELPALGSGPYGVAAAERRVYLTDVENDQVLILDRDGRFLGRLSVPGQPRSLALSPDYATLYVTSLSAGLLTAVEVEREQARRAISLPVSGTFAVAPHPEGGKLYLTAHQEGLLLVVEASSGAVLKRLSIGADPRAVSFSPDGTRAFVTSASANQIAIVDTRGDTLVGTYATGRQPRGIALDQPLVESLPTLVGDSALEPEAFALYPGYPNPFNASLCLTYSLAGTSSTWVNLQVFDLLGQPVRTLVDRRQGPGRHQVEWDGRDEAGRPLASGVYLIALRAEGKQAVQKVLHLR